MTKDFPARKEQSLSIGSSYNPNMNINQNFLTYQGGALDFLAIDDGTYSIPIDINEKISYTFEHDPQLTEITQKFNPELGVIPQQNFLNYNFSYYLGNRFDIGDQGKSLGYIASISYRTDYKMYNNIQLNNYKKNSDKDVYDLEMAKQQSGNLGVTNVILNALAGITYKTGYSKYKFNLLHIRNGEKKRRCFYA